MFEIEKEERFIYPKDYIREYALELQFFNSFKDKTKISDNYQLAGEKSIQLIDYFTDDNVSKEIKQLQDAIIINIQINEKSETEAYVEQYEEGEEEDDTEIDMRFFLYNDRDDL